MYLLKTSKRSLKNDLKEILNRGNLFLCIILKFIASKMFPLIILVVQPKSFLVFVFRRFSLDMKQKNDTCNYILSSRKCEFLCCLNSLPLHHK